jgi:hypothetical protein
MATGFGMQSSRADRHVDSGYNSAVRNVVFVSPFSAGRWRTCAPRQPGRCPYARHRALAQADNYEGDCSFVVRHPDTEVVTAAIGTITKTIAIEYG